MKATKPGENAKRAAPLVKILESLGYENLDSDASEVRYNIAAHLVDRDT